MKDVFKTVSQIVFVAISLAFVVLLTAGFRINAGQLANIEFWGEVVVKEVVLIVMFNVIFDLDNRNRKARKDSKYYFELGTKQLRVKRIYKENMFPQLSEAVKLENEKRFRDEVERLLHKVTLRLCYEDLPMDEKSADVESWLVDIKEKRKLDEKMIPKLRKCANKVLSGQFKVNEVTEDGILLDFDREYNRREKPLLFDGRDLRLKQTAYKGVTFLLSTVALTCVTLTPTLVNLWESLLVNIMLMLSATVSAISSSVFYLRAQTQILERQNGFLSNRLDLQDEYVQIKEGA